MGRQSRSVERVRRGAEAKLAGRPSEAGLQTEGNRFRHSHELQAHHIELEMQN